MILFVNVHIVVYLLIFRIMFLDTRFLYWSAAKEVVDILLLLLLLLIIIIIIIIICCCSLLGVFFSTALADGFILEFE